MKHDLNIPEIKNRLNYDPIWKNTYRDLKYGFETFKDLSGREIILSSKTVHIILGPSKTGMRFSQYFDEDGFVWFFKWKLFHKRKVFLIGKWK